MGKPLTREDLTTVIQGVLHTLTEGDMGAATAQIIVTLLQHNRIERTEIINIFQEAVALYEKKQKAKYTAMDKAFSDYEAERKRSRITITTKGLESL